MDERTRAVRRRARLRRSARSWSVLTGTLAGVSAVVIPYAGVGLPDAIWAGLTGASAVCCWWRWSDLRASTAVPLPPAAPPPQLVSGDPRLDAVLARWPAGRAVVAEIRRRALRAKLRGLAIAPAWQRLDRSASVFLGLEHGLRGPAQSVLAQTHAAERALRALGERTASVERALDLADDGGELSKAHAQLVEQFVRGVSAYERLVAAAAGYVAEQAHHVVDDQPEDRLIDATDLLGGMTAALADLRMATRAA